MANKEIQEQTESLREIATLLAEILDDMRGAARLRKRAPWVKVVIVFAISIALAGLAWKF